MTDPAITPDNLVPALMAHARARGFAAGWRPGLDPVAWRERGLTLLRDLVLPDLPETPVTCDMIEEQDRGDHIAQRLVLTFAPGLTAPALMLRPKGAGPFPAALCLHDHGSQFAIGAAKCIAPLHPDATVTAWVERFFGGQPMGTALVARGFAVLAVDALGWGARAGNGYEAQQALAANLMQIGLTPAGLMAWEDMRAAAFLAAQPGISRIAAVGFSMGGYRAWQVAALAPQVQATVSVSWMASLPGLLVPGNNQIRGQSAWWMTHPGLARHLDVPDVAALAAPKPMWVEVGQADHLFPAPAVDLAFGTLQSVWQAHGAGDGLALHRPAHGHTFPPDRQAAAFDWLQANLR